MFGPSTHYRDYRTSAFQSYAIASESSLGIVPKDSSVEECAAIGNLSPAVYHLPSFITFPADTTDLLNRL